MDGYRWNWFESHLRTPFKGTQYRKDVILFAVFCYNRRGMAHRDLQEMMPERGVVLERTSPNR